MKTEYSGGLDLTPFFVGLTVLCLITIALAVYVEVRKKDDDDEPRER